MEMPKPPFIPLKCQRYQKSTLVLTYVPPILFAEAVPEGGGGGRGGGPIEKGSPCFVRVDDERGEEG